MNPIYDAKTLGRPKLALLSIQHLMAMFGATILVPILVQSYGLPLSISTALFMSGLGTLVFHLCSKFKVPAYLGSSFAFLGGFATIANMYEGVDPHVKLAYACGGIVVAGLMYLVLASIMYKIGADKVMKYLPPVVTGPVIVLIGLTLAPSAVANAAMCWPLAAVALAIIVACNIWGKGMIKIMPILLGVVGAYAVAIIMQMCGVTNVDGSPLITLAAAPSWIGLPDFTIAKFDLSAILVMAPIALASMMEHIGDISSISATIERPLLNDPGLHRTLIGDGLATSLAGLFGGPANTTYGENTGVLVLSRVYDPLVMRIAAVLAMIIGCLPPVAALIGSIPTAIIGGISFILYGMISAIGVRNLVESKTDLTDSRNLIIVATIFVCGLGFTNGITFAIVGTTITLTSLAIAAAAGIILNIIIPKGE